METIRRLGAEFLSKNTYKPRGTIVANTPNPVPLLALEVRKDMLRRFPEALQCAPCGNSSGGILWISDWAPRSNCGPASEGSFPSLPSSKLPVIVP